MTPILAPALALLLAAPPLALSERVAGAQAVEKVRYAFVIGATRPFDEVYPRSAFENKVKREIAEERVLLQEFGLSVTPVLLSKEFERIEKETKARDQWEAMKNALGSRRKVEEVICRPLLVDRALRTRFAFDPKIHAAEHQTSRAAREVFLSGKTPAGMKILRISRKGDAAEGMDEMLGKTRGDALGPKLLTPGEPQKAMDGPVFVDSEMAKVLEKEFQKKGDVTTILEERDRFSVFRLMAADPSEWLVKGIQVPKKDFDLWLAAAIESRPSR